MTDKEIPKRGRYIHCEGDVVAPQACTQQNTHSVSPALILAGGLAIVAFITLVIVMSVVL